jgi:uncharacterized Zn-finger protein
MGKDKLFKCDKKGCDKELSTKFSLQRHSLIHMNKKDFKCSHCPKTFMLQQYKIEHEYTHSRERPYICMVDGCAEKFRQRGKLSIHKQNHHKKVEGPTGFGSDSPARLGYAMEDNYPKMVGDIEEKKLPYVEAVEE